MRVIVTGDRDWYAPDLAEEIVNRLILRYGPGVVIVHRAATGIDRSFSEACQELGIDQEPHAARWNELDHPEAVLRYDKKGRAYNAFAGPIRNAEMIAAGAQMCIAIHRAISASKGTRDCVRQALEAGIPTYLIDSEQGRPKRLGAGDATLV